MTLLEKLNRLPPCICRLLAQRNGVLATDAELQLMTGWSQSKFDRIAYSGTWADVVVCDVDALLEACGISWTSQRRERWKLLRNLRNGLDGLKSMTHLKKPVAARKRRVHSLLKRTEKVLRKHSAA